MVETDESWKDHRLTPSVPVNSIRHLAITLLLGLVPIPAGAVTVAEERADAMEVLRQHEVTGYAFSTCRWLRRRSDDALLARYRIENADVLSAAMAVIDDQGGLTAPRRKVVESLAVNEGSALASSSADCEQLFAKTRAGGRDLGSLLPAASIRRILTHRESAGAGTLWILEERRRPDGTLGKNVRPWEGEGTIDDCDKGAAAQGHIWTRQAMHAPGVVFASDPELWLAECVMSSTDPLMEEASPPLR